MAGIGSRIRSSQLWRSVFRRDMPRDRQARALAVLSNVFLHIHPVEMRRHSLRFGFTWAMGWLTFVLLAIEVVSGVALMFYYRPAAEHAYADMQALRAHVSFGLVREVHRWGGHAMVIAAWLHMLRVFLTGSYKRPREFNWCVGVALLVLTMLLSFTGYLLPWDQLAMWAVTVGTNMVAAAPLIGRDGPGSGWLSANWDPKTLLLGGESVGPPALLRFFVLHCAALPAVTAVLVCVHFWRVRKDGGISAPQDAPAAPTARGGLKPVPKPQKPTGWKPVPHRFWDRFSRRVPLMIALTALAAMILSAAVGSWSGVKGLVDWFCRPERLLPVVTAGLAVGLLSYRCWTRPVWSVVIGAGLPAGWIAAACDANFRRILLEPDNVAITLMIFTTIAFLWLGARRMAINDVRLEHGLPPIEAEDDQRVMVWPNVILIELIILMAATAVLIGWAVLIRAPLEAPADPTDVPNPSKAPWYFVGLQELLVYFDPWFAGFMLPVLTVVGLCALPYLDVNPHGNGYYTLRQRPLAHAIFLFGFVVLWLLPIAIGTFLRGPNWSLFGPFEPWDPHRVTAGMGINLSEVFWSGWLGRPMPSGESAGPACWLIREAPGLVALAAYFVGVPRLLARTLMRDLAARMGGPRYAVMMFLLTVMTLVPIKMLLRWMCHLKYIVSIPEGGLNL